MHDPTRVRVERLPMVHRAPVVPHQDVADLPGIGPSEVIVRCQGPDFIEYVFGLVDGKTVDVGICAAADI